MWLPLLFSPFETEEETLAEKNKTEKCVIFSMFGVIFHYLMGLVLGNLEKKVKNRKETLTK